MKKNYRIAFIGLFFTFLVGCQSMPGNDLFSLGHSDQNINAAVNSAFINNLELSSIPIHVETQHGMVLLSGYVKTIRQSDIAGDIASRVPGVKGVQNGLIVRK